MPRQAKGGERLLANRPAGILRRLENFLALDSSSRMKRRGNLDFPAVKGEIASLLRASQK